MSANLSNLDLSVKNTPTGSTLNCKGWVQEAALRMLLNNLDPDVAEKPEDIDLESAKTALERAEKSLNGSEGADLTRAELEIDRAKTRIQIAG